MAHFHILDLRNIPILQQLRLEEALLRADSRNWCLFNRGSSDAIVMGISANIEQVIDTDRYQANPVPLIRRFSGGGTVYIDPHTCFATFIANSADLSVPCLPRKILQWTEPLYQSAIGHDAFSIQENDYAIANKKFGGNAQYIQRNRWLHHTSLLWDFCPENMRLLRFPPRVPTYRQGRSHNEFLCRLRDWHPTPDALFSAFLSTLETRYSCERVPLETVLPLLQKPHRTATRLCTMNTNSAT